MKPASPLTMDAGYDYEPIYTQMYRMGQQSVIAYNKRNESELIGFDKYFAPTCFRKHPYRYDSDDTKYEKIKYTQSTHFLVMNLWRQMK